MEENPDRESTTQVWMSPLKMASPLHRAQNNKFLWSTRCTDTVVQDLTVFTREPIEDKVMRGMVDMEKEKKKKVGMKGFTMWIL